MSEEAHAPLELASELQRAALQVLILKVRLKRARQFKAAVEAEIACYLEELRAERKERGL